MSWQNERSMTARQYKAVIAELGMSQAAAGRYLGVSERTTHRYASGDAKLRASEALLLRALLHHNEKPEVPAWKRPYRLKTKRQG